MAHIDYYFTVLSPWVYLAGTRLEDCAARHGATITYKPLDIGQVFMRTGGVLPKDRAPARNAYRLQELKRWSQQLDTKINLQPAHWPTNAAPASCAIIAAQAANPQAETLGQLVHSLVAACWAQDQDIAQDAVIKSCLTAAGFDPNLSSSGLLIGAETYARNLEDAVNAGVFGSPFYVCDDGELFWGQDRLDALDLHLTAHS